MPYCLNCGNDINSGQFCHVTCRRIYNETPRLKDKFRLWYRIGGTANFRWLSTNIIGNDVDRVSNSGREVRKMGYATVVVTITTTEITTYEPDGVVKGV